jgi:glycosyltransferase involved in cell wall biosynthesis
MKIAVIGVKGLPAAQGGIERYCEELYSRLVSRGHSVDLFARSSYIERSWFSIYHYKGVRVICLPSLPLRGLDALTSSALSALASTIKGYDIVHFHALGPALFSWLPRIVSSARIIVTCQGLDWQRAKWGKFSRQIIYWGERAAVKYAHELVVVSEALRSYFQKTYSRETAYIPNGPAQYPQSDPQFTYVRSLNLKPKNYILFLGRLVPEKRPDLLIEAFQRLQPPGWKLALVGGVSDTEGFTSELVRLADNNPNIILTGELQGKNLAEVVRGAGLFVLPSDLEGLPLVMLEAMREGIPIVASDIPPHRQLLAQERGLLFQAGNVNSCIHSLQEALAHPLEMENRATKAQKYVEANYNWDKITADNLIVYTNLLKGHNEIVRSPVGVGDRKRDAA